MEKLAVLTVVAALALVGIAAGASVPPDDIDLLIAQDPQLWRDDEFVPFNGDRFDGFDWQLCKTLQRTEQGNIVVSPIGVKLLLAMLYEGTAGTSAQELETTLQLPQTRQKTREKFSAVLESLQESNPDYVLDIATKMYVDNRVFPRAKFLKILQYFYKTEMERIDFLQPEPAAKVINTWVEGATNGHISKIIGNPEEDLESVKLMLVNALFFKGTWQYPFPGEETTTLSFTVSPTRSVSVDYMRQTNNFYYYNSTILNAQILRLPYLGKKYSMFVVLPNSPTGLTRLLENVTPDLVRQVMTNMSLVEIDILVPRFKFDYTANLVEVLQKLGLNEIFTESADLQGVLSRRQANNLYVSNVVQKAAIEVNEKGTTASAVTQISTGNRFGQGMVFNAKHPFLFFIEDETTGTVLFVGKVIDPTSEVASVPDKSVPTKKPTKNPTSETIGTRIGEPAVEKFPQLYPININWGWPPPLPSVTNRNNYMPGDPTANRNQVRQPIGQPLFPTATGPFVPRIPGTGYPAVILYPVYIQGFNK